MTLERVVDTLRKKMTQVPSWAEAPSDARGDGRIALKRGAAQKLSFSRGIKRSPHLAESQRHRHPGETPGTHKSGYYFCRFSSWTGWSGLAFLAEGSGFQAMGLAGALGFTPKSQTFRFIPSLPNISTTAYSPGVKAEAGVTIIQPSVKARAVVGTSFCSWLTLP